MYPEGLALLGSTAVGWSGIAPHLKLQWAAVTTQFSLIKEPPQKWDPERVWGGRREEELGLGRLSPPEAGDRLSQVPLVPA